MSSAVSDIVLTYTGGKLIKVAWKGTQLLYQGAKTLGKEILVGKTQTIVHSNPRQSEMYVGKMLGTKARPQVSYLNGKERYHMEQKIA